MSSSSQLTKVSILYTRTAVLSWVSRLAKGLSVFTSVCQSGLQQPILNCSDEKELLVDIHRCVLAMMATDSLHCGETSEILIFSKLETVEVQRDFDGCLGKSANYYPC